ncbi:hypothetical protein LOD99_12051 [Oopsacas minuta]|uniref:Mos1 transposase HTH domain-containing protein n=1 Tax=Oopsacas minuta TaxID=111878 RepID=A0AAV7JH58_9METZ|nr:hypothetical protein LOD99_12051 [Oopsacas minuta]
MASNLKFEQRSYIKIRTLLGIDPKDILIDLEVVYGDASLSYTTVKEWAKRFHEGQESLEDEERIGRLRSAVTSSNTSEIRWRVEEDPQITDEELAMSVGVLTRAVHSILIDELCLSEVEKHYWEQRPKPEPWGMRLLHDNAQPHKTKLIKSELDRMRVVEPDNPLYSPDLAACDLWLFAKVEKGPCREEFCYQIDLQRNLELPKDIPPEDYKNVFFKWLDRLQRVKDINGDYFEKIQQL